MHVSTKRFRRLALVGLMSVAGVAAGATSQIVNLSVRSGVGTGDDVLVAGFAVSGGDKPLLIRAVGPTLAGFGVSGALLDPQLRLLAGSTPVAANDNWSSATNADQIAATSKRVGAFDLPTGSADAAILTTAGPGVSSAVSSGVGGTTGIALIEVYDTDLSAAGRLINVSARTQVGTDDNILVAGFVISGTASQMVLIRGVGPTLANFGVGNALVDPQLKLLKGDTVVAQNDNWGDYPADAARTSAAATQVGAFALPTGSKDAALLAVLAPGGYTTQVSGVNRTTGVGLLEVYAVDGFVPSVTPASRTIAVGGSAGYTVTIDAPDSFSGPVALSVSGLPAGASATFSPAALNGAGTSTLTITTSSSTVQGTFPLTITASGGGMSRTTGVNLALTSSAGFIHPGILVNRAQLDLIKSRVAAGLEPQKSAFAAAQKSSYGSLTYTPVPWQTVECGSYSNPDYGCTDEKRDSDAAYLQALLWYVTGNETYAKNAIRIMNAWSGKLTGGHTNSNGPLQSAWCAEVWPRAAEIIRYTYNGWSDADIAQFKAMLANQYLPPIINGSCSNGNWELSMAEAVINIGIFNDDRATYNKGLTLWRNRVPAYFYLNSDGPSPKTVPHCGSQSWNGATTYVDGLCQETCRDLGHTQYGLAAAINAAETARQQGVDLYGEQSLRLRAAMEFHAQFLNGAPVPNWLCGGTLSAVSPDDTWEIAYNHYHDRLGFSLPQTQALIGRIRPTSVDHHMAWETLTHGSVGAVGLP